jgi:AcrR family transcriptional regulator
MGAQPREFGVGIASTPLSPGGPMIGAGEGLGIGETEAGLGDPVMEILTLEAIRLIDELGPAALTVRALAARTHYAPSTVSYHLESVNTLKRDVWQRIAMVLSEQVVGIDATGDDWPPIALAVLGSWVEEHPNLARFFTSGNTGPDAVFSPKFSADFERRWSIRPDYQGAAEVAVFFGRRLQSWVEMLWRGHRSAGLPEQLRAVLLIDLAQTRDLWSEVTTRRDPSPGS